MRRCASNGLLIVRRTASQPAAYYLTIMEKGSAKIPHQQLDYRPVHITYRLAGSLSKAILSKIRKNYEIQLATLDAKLAFHPEILQSGIYKREAFKLNAQYELDIDQALHTVRDGPFHLKKPELAIEVIDSWKFLQEQGAVYVYVVCVMGNHVHAVVRAPDGEDEIEIGKLMNRHKAHTARVCNQLIGKVGTPFWEHLYFDRRVRRGKFARVMWYVLNNPVKVNLVDDWRDWGGTYLNPQYDALFRNSLG